MVTDRQKREKEFYEQFSQDKSLLDVSFAPIEGTERRPWDPYWYVIQRVKDEFRPGARLLDFGCGWGENSVIFAKTGYQVEGFDISEGNLRAARALAERYGVADRMNFSIRTAERTTYPDESFDVVVGIDILHHVEVEAAVRECRRALKPGGIAIFREPVENRIFDTLRNLSVVRKLVPNTPSLERHITEDERKLNAKDIEAIRRVFGGLEKVESFRVLSRLERLIRFPLNLEKLDYMCRAIPGFSRFRGTVVIVARK